MNARPLLTLALFALASCGAATEEKTSSEDLRTFDVQEEAPSAPQAAADGTASSSPAATEVQVALPQIAYTYSYAFRLPAEQLVAVQEQHLDLCESLGPARCRVVDMKRSASSGDYVEGSLTLQVAAPIARDFGQRVVAAAASGGAETIDRGIAAEDLSKQIVDTAARIRTKEALVERLTTLLETRSGNIAQAVEAERAINAAQEELEQARAWLAEMRGRVAMSTFEIGYQSGAPLEGGVSEPLRDAFGRIGDLFGTSLAAIITILAIALPWLLVGGLALLLVRRIRRRRPELSGETEEGGSEA